MLTANTPNGDEFAIDQTSSVMVEEPSWTELQDYGLTSLSVLSCKTA